MTDYKSIMDLIALRSGYSFMFALGCLLLFIIYILVAAFCRFLIMKNEKCILPMRKYQMKKFAKVNLIKPYCYLELSYILLFDNVEDCTEAYRDKYNIYLYDDKHTIIDPESNEYYANLMKYIDIFSEYEEIKGITIHTPKIYDNDIII